MKSIFKDIEKYADNTALFVGHEKTSYQKLIITADELASQVKQRCLVLIACSNCLSSITGYVGFLRAGIVPMLISNKINLQLLTKLVKDYLPDYLYLPSDISGTFQRYETVIKLDDYELKKNTK